MVSHLPVSAVSLLLPELLDARRVLTNSSETRQSLVDLREYAENLYSLINSTLTTFFTNQQVSTHIIYLGLSYIFPQSNRQQEIIQIVLDFLTRVLDGSIDITMKNLMFLMESLSDHLAANSQDAVLDYLIW